MKRILIYAGGGLLGGLLVASGIQPHRAVSKATLAVYDSFAPAGVKSERLSGTVSAEDSKEEQTTKTQEKMATIPLTKSDFLEKIVNYEKEPDGWHYLGDRPALIDFYADWCGPCKRLAPELEALAEEYAGRIYIYKVNTEQEQELAAVFGIRSIPTLIFVPMEGQPQLAMGALPRAQLKKIIEKVLLQNSK